MENLWSSSYAVKLYVVFDRCLLFLKIDLPLTSSSPYIQSLQFWLTILHKIQLHASFISLLKVCLFPLIIVRSMKTLVSDMILSYKGKELTFTACQVINQMLAASAFPLLFQPTGSLCPVYFT